MTQKELPDPLSLVIGVHRDLCQMSLSMCDLGDDDKTHTLPAMADERRCLVDRATVASLV